MRLLSGLSMFGLFVLSLVSLPAKASAVVMTMGDGAECGIPPTPFTVVPMIPGAGGSATGCFISIAPIFRLDFTFAAPPAPAGVTCSSTFFFACNATESAGITDISFTGPPGIPNAALFEVTLSGFTPGQTVTGFPNVPEPSTAPPVLLAAVAIAISSRLLKKGSQVIG